MKKKMRKFSDGGVSEGQNPNIDDDTRSRAMKFVEDASEESRDIGAPVTRSASKTSSKVSQTVAPSKPKVDQAAEKTRMEELTKKQALETVSPELDIMPAAKLATGAGALYAGARAIGKRVLAGRAAEKAAEETAKKAAINAEMKAASDKAAKTQATRVANKTRRSEEGYSPEEALKARKKASMKAGGSVKSSQMSKANGIAKRGLTRGKMC
jgi:hypothetical protein